tara:strand:+ start:5388 stop:6119 length:732 start_codon:yes stop_codon:yes gene_type:complete
MAKQVNKQPKNWSDEELVAWAIGDITPGKDITEEALAEEAFKRMGQEAGSVDEAKEALRAAVEEPATEEVAEEPKAAEPVPEPTPEPKPEPAAVKEAPKPASDNPSMRIVEENLEDYVARMKPGKAHTGNEGPVAQVKLYRTIQTVLRMEGSAFIQAYGYLLKVVNDHRKDVFDERYLFRYFDALALTSPERRNFERILNLLVTTCEPKLRSKSIKQVDLDATMEGFRNPEMHQRVVEFYNGV